jgi:hypothetical protein
VTWAHLGHYPAAYEPEYGGLRLLGLNLGRQDDGLDNRVTPLDVAAGGYQIVIQQGTEAGLRSEPSGTRFELLDSDGPKVSSWKERRYCIRLFYQSVAAITRSSAS